MKEAIQREPSSTDVVITTVNAKATQTQYSASSEYNAMVLSLLRQSARGGNAESLARLGAMHACGDGVRKHYRAARALLRRAADQGHPLALYNLGVMYAHGYGTDVNPEVAFNCYLKAAGLGNLDALNNLAVCYQNGFGCVRSLDLAFEKFREAARGAAVIALSNCGYMKELGLGTNLDEQEAIGFYRTRRRARLCGGGLQSRQITHLHHHVLLRLLPWPRRARSEPQRWARATPIICWAA